MKGLKVQFLGAMLLANSMLFFAIEGNSTSTGTMALGSIIMMLFGIFIGDD